jgi:hypothetical protein
VPYPVGTADDCVATLAATAERTGVEHIVLMVGGAEKRASNMGPHGFVACRSAV